MIFPPAKFAHNEKCPYFCKINGYFLFTMGGTYKINETIKAAVQQVDEPTIFFITDFPEYGHEYVRKVLAGLVEDGELIRLSKGVYMRPKMTRLGALYPDIETIVQAIALRDSANVLPTGAAAENLLGLSEQVPMNYVYLTDGSSRVLTLGQQTIHFKRVVPKNFAIKNKTLAILALAMKSIGEKNLTDEQLGRIREIVRGEMNSESFQADLNRMPIWEQAVINKIIKETNYEQVD